MNALVIGRGEEIEVGKEGAILFIDSVYETSPLVNTLRAMLDLDKKKPIAFFSPDGNTFSNWWGVVVVRGKAQKNNKVHRGTFW